MAQLHATVHDDLPRVRERLEKALAAEGFGVLTHIDLQATLKEKLGIDREAHHILGVCSPQLAAKALDADPDIALLLPCTVTLRDTGEATEIRILDPERAFALADDAIAEDLEPLAQDARRHLAAALEAVTETPQTEGAAT